jgi:hypothetical protein
MKAAKLVYLILGTLSLAGGVTALVVPSLAVPPDALSALTSHLVREQAAYGVFLGLMLYWCLWHFEQRRHVHLALLVFTALFSGVHWLEYMHGHRGLLSPVLNTLPFLGLSLTAPWRERRQV